RGRTRRARPARAAGAGAPPDGHQDPPARSSLDWDWPTRLTAAKASSQEARPGAERSVPPGRRERRKWSVVRRARRSQGALAPRGVELLVRRAALHPLAFAREKKKAGV